jgi:chemotaxis protein methyltransferase CheR
MKPSPAAFDTIRRHVFQLCGLVLGDDKTYLVRQRLEPVVRAAGLRDFDAFATLLGTPAGAAHHAAVVEAIVTKETSFFRDGHPFEAFRLHVLPAMAARVRTGGRPRVWCAAASTGQEPYSLAMLIHDHLAGAGLPPGSVGVLATDVSAQALEAARAGVFADWETARGLTPALLAKHFVRGADGGWSAGEHLRRLVEFRRLNLTLPFVVPGLFDVVFCRNVLIYFDEATRRRVVEQLTAALPIGGWLVLGAAENLYGISDRFDSVRLGESLVYRKKS